MTISLEEHVARAREELARGRMARWPGYRHGGTWENIGPEQRAYWLEGVSDVDAQSAARAAIAAVRELEGEEPSELNLRHSVEHIAALVNDGLLVEADSVLHAIELSAVDRLGPSTVTTPLPGTGGKTDQAPDPAEAIRAKCEAIARGEPFMPERYNHYICEVGNANKPDAGNWSDWGDYAKARNAAGDAIAALKGNGEGR